MILDAKYKIGNHKIKDHKVSIFIPIFNEERLIDRSIRMVNYVIGKFPVEYEIFIVNDGSRDRTKIIAEKIEQAATGVTLLNFERGPTRRENLAQSFKKAHGDIIVLIDVDLTVSLRFLPDLIDQVISGYDIVTGSRYITGSKMRRKPLRLFTSLICNACIRLFFRTHIHDHMCGFKAFKKDAILRLIDEMGYDQSLKRGIFWDAEMLIRGHKHGYKTKEIPIWWKERKKTALNFKREIKTISYIFKFMMKLGKEKDLCKQVGPPGEH